MAAELRWRRNISRFISSPSTTSARSPASAKRFEERGARRSFSIGTVNQNVDPSPGTLATPMRPPRSVTSSFEMASPRPVPPNLRFVLPSTCMNGVNSRSWSAAAIPMPVSLTRNQSTTPLSRSLSCITDSVTSPSEVNLMALPTRLTITCRMRSASPRSWRCTSG